MQKQQLLGAVALLAATAIVACIAGPGPVEEQSTPPKGEAVQVLCSTPVARVEGELRSPDGRFQVQAAGASGQYVSGVQPPEFVQVVDAKTGDVLWQDQGWVTQTALWSPDSRYLALAYGARTWQAIRVIETNTWTGWDFTLPDGSPIPEYTFLPDNWGDWPEEDHLRVTVGRGGDAGEQHTYACALVMDQDRLTGASMEVVRETLPGTYDFDHDGALETVERWTYVYPSGGAELYELRIWNAAEDLCWKEEAGASHTGENAVYTLKVDGQDYLLRYVPFMGQGYCTYHYQLFSLDEKMQPVVLREDRVEFDINWGSPYHSFDSETVAAFLYEVHGWLDNAEVLIDTTFGEVYIGDVDYQDLDAIELCLRAMEQQ